MSLSRCITLRVAHAPGIPGTSSTPRTSRETASLRSRHASRHVRPARAVMHVGNTYSRWRGKRSRHSRCMRNPQFYLSGKRPMPSPLLIWIICVQFIKPKWSWFGLCFFFYCGPLFQRNTVVSSLENSKLYVTKSYTVRSIYLARNW